MNGAISKQLGWEQVRANVCLVGELEAQYHGTSSAKLKQEPQVEMWEKKTGRQRQIQAQQSGKGHRLPPLQYRELVLVQDLRASKTEGLRGRCVDQLTERSYTVDVDGQLVHRNRQFIKPSSHVPERRSTVVDDIWEACLEAPKGL